MTDLSAIAEKIAALRADDDVYENGARVISQGGVPDGMAAFIDAIDGTVLERHLEIMTGSHIVTVVAAGRRLRGIVNVIPPKGKSARLVGEPLSRDDRRMLESVGTLLSDLFSPAPKLTIRNLPAEPFGKSGDRGVAASELARLWDVDLDAEPLPKVDRFLRSNSGLFTAHLHVNNGEVVATSGDAGTLQQIWEDQIDAFLTTQKKLSGHTDGPQLISLEGALDGKQSIALGLAGDDVLLMIYDSSGLGQMHASWQAIFS
ncbi:hypothetical protein [Yoonia litorea]|uniref:Uncharacterized protein n=1 Tax=Yoonia litorea TaxID=1123755 RepID=A0A1I6N2Q0_9RHOB|nr:hypothetical protein [Yoonia litorea]SFS22229.1 hypothetical protein SAMN05444714_3209 [Yoonia litorea]